MVVSTHFSGIDDYIIIFCLYCNHLMSMFLENVEKAWLTSLTMHSFTNIGPDTKSCQQPITIQCVLRTLKYPGPHERSSISSLESTLFINKFQPSSKTQVCSILEKERENIPAKPGKPEKKSGGSKKGGSSSASSPEEQAEKPAKTRRPRTAPAKVQYFSSYRIGDTSTSVVFLQYKSPLLSLGVQ